MTCLEDLKPDALVKGLVGKEAVRLISVQRMGDMACQVFYRGQDGSTGRADSKSHYGFGDGWRVAIASNAVMSCITACIPARIDRNPASLSRFIAAVRSVAIAPAPLPR